MYKEISRKKNEILNLQLSLQKYTGDDLNTVQFEELKELEHQLEQSVQKVRARKVKKKKKVKKFFNFKFSCGVCNPLFFRNDLN